MSSQQPRSIQILLLGATGYTGKFVFQNLVRITSKPEYSDIKLGVSGRSKENIQSLINDNINTDYKISDITTFECDVLNDVSLKETVQYAQVVINCTGPNTILSEPIIKACIAAGTHYVDISAELYHMLNMYRDYHKKAEDANVLIVTGCGFATIPVTAGLTYLERLFKGTLHSVECYTIVDIPRRTYFPGCNKCLVHYGTWASLVHELKNFKKYQELNQQTFPDDVYGSLPSELKKSFFHKHNGRLYIPYPGPEYGAVDMSQRYQLKEKQKKPFFFKIYTTVPLLIHFLIVPAFFLYYYACAMKCFRTLLFKFPRFFTLGYMSKKGPSEKNRNDTKYSFTLIGKGRADDAPATDSNKTLTVKVSGSDPGYQTTAIACIAAAFTILKDYSQMPKGGVLTTGAAFHETNIIDTLIENDMKFEVIDTK